MHDVNHVIEKVIENTNYFFTNSNYFYKHQLQFRNCNWLFNSNVVGPKSDHSCSLYHMEHVDYVYNIESPFVRFFPGVPDPPLDIQVEAGPQEGTLLVTWLPVTITATGKSKGAEVKGYAIYLDGRHVKNVNSPTGEIEINFSSLD